MNGVLGYIGPGGGLVITFSFFTVLLVVLGIFGVIFVWPISAGWLWLIGKCRRKKGYFDRVLILGLDGFDPKVARDLMQKGKLLNLQQLAHKNGFRELKTTFPSLSPCAWSTFMTGKDASYHNIYDFIKPDKHTYKPVISSYEVNSSGIRPLRKSVPFWKTLGKFGIESTILRVPITFPPEPFKGRLLSGMCVPDILGSQGTYSVLSTKPADQSEISGEFYQLKFKNNVAKIRICGPDSKSGINLKIKRISLSRLKLSISGQKIILHKSLFSKWMRISFRSRLKKINGIVQFYLISSWPDVKIYMSPIHLDPEKPAMSISHPGIFSDYLSKRDNVFGTLGLMEDTSALNEGVIKPHVFLKQTYDFFDERKRMFLETLRQKKEDLLVCVFDTPDRIQHMFWGNCKDRFSQPKYNASCVIDRMYQEMDNLVGETLKLLPPKTLFLVLSDHGFTSFERGVNLNTWLYQNGYLHLKPGMKIQQDWLEGVNWSKTKAFAMGLTGVYVNLKGRQKNGIVEPGSEYEKLTLELKNKFENLEDREVEDNNSKVVRRAVITSEYYKGPYRNEGSDILIGYQSGYRCSWECAKGQITDEVFVDNNLKWSGDHCVDPELVPGVLFSNHPLKNDEITIADISQVVLDTFGVTYKT